MYTKDVDHGKSTLVERLSGTWTDTHSEEIKRGITIRLGYADASFYKCDKCGEYTTQPKCKKCKGDSKFLRRVSFIDAPGHETLMATMLSGAAIMDGALLLIAANEECPQPQTQEHLMALEIIGVKNIVIVQNKIDLISQEQALKNYKQIKSFVKGTIAKDAPIIPISAKQNINISTLIESIETVMKTPKRDDKKIPQFYIARSFDVNKPGTPIDKLIGGVIGGALKQGRLKINDEIEIRPGIRTEREGKIIWNSVFTRISGLKTGGSKVKEITPGGSIGILTELDPSIVKSDSLTGNIAGLKDKLPPVRETLILEPTLLERMVGMKDELVIEPIKKDEPLMLNVNSAATIGTVVKLEKNKIHIELKISVCCEKERVTISRRIGTRWRLIGYGNILEK